MHYLGKVYYLGKVCSWVRCTILVRYVLVKVVRCTILVRCAHGKVHYLGKVCRTIVRW